MIESRASRAPTSPPETGASRLITPRGERLPGNFHGQRRLAGGHVDEDRPRAAAGQDAVAAEDHLADVRRIADDAEDHVGLLGHGPRRRGPAGTRRQKPLGLRLACGCRPLRKSRRGGDFRTCSSPSRRCRSSRDGAWQEKPREGRPRSRSWQVAVERVEIRELGTRQFEVLCACQLSPSDFPSLARQVGRKADVQRALARTSGLRHFSISTIF